MPEEQSAHLPESSSVLQEIIESGSGYGHSRANEGKRVLVEFVSANPNGPLTAAHGRGGVVGDTLAALFFAVGYEVEREFYVNDAPGSRARVGFAHAVWSRYRRLAGRQNPVFSGSDDYPGEYVEEIAQSIYEAEGDRYVPLSNEEALPLFATLAFQRMQEDQRKTLATFEIRFDNYVSEADLYERGAIEDLLKTLEVSGHLEKQSNNAVYLTTASAGENGAVLVRADGTPTYLAGDLAYHHDKFTRGFDRLIDVWDADHKGYVDRTQAGLAALGYAPERLQVVVYRPVRLLQEGAEVKGSRRYGSGGVTLDELCQEIGPEAARFFLLQQPPDKTLDLDMDAARRTDAQNPLAHIRQSLAQARTAAESGKEAKLRPADQTILDKLGEFPGVVTRSANELAPHYLPRYAIELAALWDTSSQNAVLAQGVLLVLQNALILMGISPHSAPLSGA